MVVLIVNNDMGNVNIRGLSQLRYTMEASIFAEIKVKLGFEDEDAEDLPDTHEYFTRNPVPNKYNATMKDTELLSILTDFKFIIVSQSDNSRTGIVTWTLERDPNLGSWSQCVVA